MTPTNSAKKLQRTNPKKCSLHRPNRRQRALDAEERWLEQTYEAELGAHRAHRYSKEILRAHELAAAALEEQHSSGGIKMSDLMLEMRTCDSSELANLGQEIEEGNVEYKLKLVGVSEERLAHLITQMHWRLAEGHDEAIYQIGVRDNGHPLGLCDDELKESLGTLQRMADALEAHTKVR
jgi:hypothetical protein